MVTAPDLGWRRVAPTPALAEWARAAAPLAVAALGSDQTPRRAGGTWAVGLDLLPNAPDGCVAGQPLPMDDLGVPPCPLHRAQVSTVYPGYPQPSAEETPAAFRFRAQRDAAHLDGLLPIGPHKRRMVKEPHAWIAGIALSEADPNAAPLVVWEGSHTLMRAALRPVFAAQAGGEATEVDVTEAYQAARAQVFETCRRVEVPCAFGHAVVLHRLLIHGVAPWAPNATAAPEGRIMAYFRPLLPSVEAWLSLP